MKQDDSVYGPDAALARIDAIAAAALSIRSLRRYQAYKQVLLAREQDRAAVISTLTLFIADLSEPGDSAATLRPGNET